MAGIICADTLQDGAGNSTAMDNAIYGSAKAWVYFGGGQTTTAGQIFASYNVSSVTVNGTGDYTINFTNAFSNAYYCISGSAAYNDGTSMNVMTPDGRNITASSLRVFIEYVNGGKTLSAYNSVCITK